MEKDFGPVTANRVTSAIKWERDQEKAVELQRQESEAFRWLVEHEHICGYERQGLRGEKWQVRVFTQGDGYRYFYGSTLLEAIQSAKGAGE